MSGGDPTQNPGYPQTLVIGIKSDPFVLLVTVSLVMFEEIEKFGRMKSLVLGTSNPIYGP